LKASLVFDADHYAKLNAARGAVVRELIADLQSSLDLRSAIDVGCGLGHFSELLRSNGFQVTGVDGRAENVEEARLRNRDVQFYEFNAEDSNLLELGTFDLCFCFGLLYHLENPFLAIRHLRALTKTLLLAEGVILQGTEPIMALVDETLLRDQGLHNFAFYPTEACLIKMFYKAGFAHVYGLTSPPQHPDYHSSADSRRVRTLLAASLQPIRSTKLKAITEPASNFKPWDPSNGIEASRTSHRLRRFAGKPFLEKVETLKRVVKKPKER
jgi:SAM-dependent methyltransferase